MITAKLRDGEVYKVDHLINRGRYFGKTWFIGLGCGFDIHRIVVEAANEQDAIDELADSKYAYLIKIDDDEITEDTTYAGNYGIPVNLDELRIIERCKVNYFAKKNQENLR